MVSPATVEEEDEVEEIIRAKPQTQSVQILHKRGDEVVVVEEEDTPKEIRRLKSTLARVVKQIKVSTESGAFVVVVGDRIPLLSLGISGNKLDCRAVAPVDKEDGTPPRGEPKTQRGDKPLGDTHSEGPARARPR